jgi:hypothetical protein
MDKVEQQYRQIDHGTTQTKIRMYASEEPKKNEKKILQP